MKIHDTIGVNPIWPQAVAKLLKMKFTWSILFIGKECLTLKKVVAFVDQKIIGGTWGDKILPHLKQPLKQLCPQHILIGPILCTGDLFDGCETKIN